MSQCSCIFLTSPLTHPWHPNWLKVAASPLLGLLLPLLLHLPRLPKQLLRLLPPFPSVTPWLWPRGGRRPGGGRAGSPRNDELRVARAWGQEGRAGSGRAPVLSAPPSSPKGRSCGGREGGRPSRSRVWSGSAEGRPPAPGCAGVRVCTCGEGRGGPEVEGEPFLASDAKRGRENPKFLPQEVRERGVLPLR